MDCVLMLEVGIVSTEMHPVWKNLSQSTLFSVVFLWVRHGSPGRVSDRHCRSCLGVLHVRPENQVSG